jgi:hypothetical protein
MRTLARMIPLATGRVCTKYGGIERRRCKLHRSGNHSVACRAVSSHTTSILQAVRYPSFTPRPPECKTRILNRYHVQVMINVRVCESYIAFLHNIASSAYVVLLLPKVPRHPTFLSPAAGQFSAPSLYIGSGKLRLLIKYNLFYRTRISIVLASPQVPKVEVLVSVLDKSD